MSQTTPTTPPVPARSRRKTEVGIVTSDKMNKTRRVEVETLYPHPKYGKLLKRRTICHAHDETNQTHLGDIVEIMETRPLSKMKRWRIVRIVRPGAQQALAGEGERSGPGAPSNEPDFVDKDKVDPEAYKIYQRLKGCTISDKASENLFKERTAIFRRLRVSPESVTAQELRELYNRIPAEKRPPEP
jgi:small subunit ribosomal protein S17